MPTAFHPTHNVLLATDLSARCDRAMDRAIQLATRHRSKLVVLHVYEPRLSDHLAAPSWHRDPEAQWQLARQRLTRDLDGREMNMDILIEMGDPVDCIRNTADSRHCEVIVMGMARDQTLGRMLVGTTVEKLIRVAHAPLLVVKNRVHRPYATVLVATDFSPESADMIPLVQSMLPDVQIRLFHSYLPQARRGAPPDEFARQAAARVASSFLTETPGLGLPADTPVVLEPGEPEVALNEYVQRHDIDLVITGSHARTGLLRTAIPSVAENLIRSLPTDVMIVRPRVAHPS